LSHDISVLVIDDNPGFRREIVDIVERLDFVEKAQGTVATDMKMIASVLVSAENTVAILDFDSCARSLGRDPDAWIKRTTAKLVSAQNVGIVILAKTSDEMLAVRMMKCGASDYMPKRLLSGTVLATCLEQFVPESASHERMLRARRKQMKYQRSEPESPFEIDGYEFVRKLYESGEVDVYLARSVIRGHEVVLKIAPFARNSVSRLARFEREFATFGRINSPCVADVYDYGKTDEFAYIALEYFPRGSLKERMAVPLSTSEAVAYLRQIATALKEIHARNVVHRDLKPPNIMLRDDDTVALIDFGIVKELGEGASLTQHGELRGSPYYMSPEQATGGNIDVRSDMYSLGVVFYEMLTQRKPYTGKDLMDVLSQHIESPPPLLPEDKAEFQPLIDYLMAKDPDYRCADAAELLSDSVFAVAADAVAHSVPLRA
jgi:DNA-binding NarL/FixJ family response regulator